ncbi:hypothetical protein IEN85_04985 [Pelagicoccus sp. NFK12]|uniref:DUF4783 domain-containing protein n=1 Tax=Pelagicoccus enzymogenes TaxID=2773457 RepID=A0A927F7U7_9BACT|nr:hypothetical protein [Pelagicoccus enzymogenes]MBD5778836.1 hypothetical protein [Pelagicoccus enzymogenes]
MARGRWLAVLALCLWPCFSRAAVPEEIAPVLQVLDRFMFAGKEGDAARGAQLLDMYETSPKKAEREIDAFFKRNSEIFRAYVSISNDLYGYEFTERGFRGRNVELEGGVDTEVDLGTEFSARLVFRDQRWRIISLEID